MVKQVLCTCIWCLQESNGQGKSVSKATRARHIIKQKKTWANPAGMPTLQRHITTPISQTTSAVSPSTVMLLPTNTTEEISNYNHGEDINIDFFENMMSDRNEEIISERSSSDEEDQIEVLEYEENEKDNDDEYDGDDDNDDDNDEGDHNNNNNEGDDKGNNEEEENNKEYNGEISEDLIKGLRLLKIKDKYNIPEAAFNEILKVFEISKVSLFKLRKLLGNIVPLEPTLVNCCINSCVAFTGEFINEDHCPYCGEFRYKSSQVARKNASYWSLINTLRAQYKDKARSETLRYRHTYTSTNEYTIGNQISDVFDGFRYKTLVSSGFFSDSRDIALIASTDGYQIFCQKRNDCWVILLINANLPPDVRVKRENLMISALIPGPKEPKNFNSFLQPLVDELKQLQGI